MATFSGDVQYTQVMGHLPTPEPAMYAIYGNIYLQYTPNVNVSIYTIHGSYGNQSKPFPTREL